MKWIYRLSDGQFLHGGPTDPEYDPAISGLAVVPRHPNPRSERYDGVGGIRAATAQESNDYETEHAEASTQGRFNDETLVKALAIWTAGKLNVPLATARAEILAILRTL
jgi:hypothetical protein